MANLAHVQQSNFKHSFGPKGSVKFACWNVRTLGKPTKQNMRLRELLRTLQDKKIEFAALFEVRWRGQGELVLHGSTFLYSGPLEHQHRTKGVAVVLADTATSAWKAAGSTFDPVSERILRVRLKLHTGYLSLIAVYAPTNDDQAESDQFYQDLQTIILKVPKRDMLLVAGDFNARVGRSEGNWNGILGEHCPDRNENGERLIDLCACNNLVVTNTLFKHRPCHQMTWYHPAEREQRGHMIDYVIVNHRFRSSILDTRVFRGTFLQSDHMLVVSKLRFELKAKRHMMNKSEIQQTNPKKLSERHVREFQLELNSSFVQPDETTSPELFWGKFKSVIQSAEKKLPLLSQNRDADWVTDELREFSEQKKQCWLRWKTCPDDSSLCTAYNRLKSLTARKAEAARNQWWEERAEEAEKKHENAVKNGWGGSLLKSLRGIQRSQNVRSINALKATNGANVVSDVPGKLSRWREHFKSVTNVQAEVEDRVLESVPSVQLSDSESQYINESLACEPTEEEVKLAIKQIKNGKSPGEDRITIELLKIGEGTLQECDKCAGRSGR